MTSKASRRCVAEHGLPTKPAEPFAESRVLGLQLSKDEETVMWRRRDRADLELPSVITKRAVFQWCGRLTGHVPVCGWLRTAIQWVSLLSIFSCRVATINRVERRGERLRVSSRRASTILEIARQCGPSYLFSLFLSLFLPLFSNFRASNPKLASRPREKKLAKSHFKAFRNARNFTV